ncbi:MAG: fasciclin domain-containing protein, partial [Flavobacteriales bacterium]
MITTLLGQDVTVTINADGVFINDAQVIVADITADNGVVHVIDAVLLPPAPPTNTILDIVVNSADHNTLEAAVVAAGLQDALSGPGPLTVFAPTDAAFAALPAGAIDALLADPTGALTEVLLYHVVGGVALSTDLADGMMITTLLGQDVTVTINADGVFINDAQVIVADIIADNGVVHVIDAVLLPQVQPSNTIMDIVANSGDHTTLEAALVASGLNETLGAPGDYTLFAPTDAAFAALPAGTIEALLADPFGALTDILLYHALGGTVLSTDLADGMMAMTLQGSDITVTINADGVFINDA